MTAHGEEERIAMNDDAMTPGPTMGEITMEAYLDDMREVLAQAEADGLVEITPSDIEK